MQSFNSGRSFRTSLNRFQPASNHSVPFDATLSLNSIHTHPKDTRRAPTIILDPKKMLTKAIRKDDSLLAITLGCATSQRGPAMWDTLFNMTNGSHANVTGCMFVTRPGYAMVDRTKAISISNYLDYSKMSSRVGLNTVSPGDHVGIGLVDIASSTTYVLLYDIVGTCMVPNPQSQDERLPAVNCKLRHFYTISIDGSADGVAFGDETQLSDMGTAFFEYLAMCANDVPRAYPWYSHFTPLEITSVDLDVVNHSASDMKVLAIDTTYEEFEEHVRNAYHSLRQLRQPFEKGAKKKDRPKDPTPPVVTAIVGAGDDIIARISVGEVADTPFRFRKSEVTNLTLLETFLIGGDLRQDKLHESVNCVVLSGPTFGSGEVMRWLTSHF